jgi:hypothetical protein
MMHEISRRWIRITALVAVAMIGGGIALATPNDGIVKEQVSRFRILGYDSYDLDVGEPGRSLGDTFS